MAAASPLAESADASAVHDLTRTLAQHLDRHLVVPMLDFLLKKNSIHERRQVLEEKLRLVAGTSLVDVEVETWKELNAGASAVPKDLTDKKQRITKHLAELTRHAQPLITLIEKPDVLQSLKHDRAANLAMMVKEHGFDAVKDYGVLAGYGRALFDCGQYAKAAEVLTHVGALSTSLADTLSACWGKLAAEILCHNWESALDDLSRLRDLIDTSANPAAAAAAAAAATSAAADMDTAAATGATATTVAVPHALTAVQAVQQRAWLLHWSLFIHFQHPRGLDHLLDLALQPHYLNAIQTMAPHLLRYVVAAVVVNKRRRGAVKEVARVVGMEAYEYLDPVVAFVHCLWNEFDYDGAQRYLSECAELLTNDYFLSSIRDEFLDNARYFMFESYCRIHKRISIPSLSQKLALPPAEGERWIVNLVRNARIDAKVDAEQGQVQMGTTFTPIYQEVIEKAKELAFRSQVVSSNVEKKEVELRAKKEQLAKEKETAANATVKA